MQFRLGTGELVWIDDADREMVFDAGPRWSRRRHHGNVYVVRVKADRGMEFLHRKLLGLKRGDGQIVDHINGDGLDNRRENLRLVEPWQSRANQGTTPGRSRFRGVTWSSERQQWRSRIRPDGRSISLGYFDSETEAAVAWNAEAVRHWGPFARLNKLDA